MISPLIFICMCAVVVLLLWFVLCFGAGNEMVEESMRTELLKVIASVIAAVFSWFNTFTFTSGAVGETTSRLVSIEAVENPSLFTVTSTYTYESVTTLLQNNLLSTALMIASFAVTVIALYYAGSCLYDLVKSRDTYLEDI